MADHELESGSISLVQRMLGRALFVGFVLSLLLIIFVAKFEFLNTTAGLAQAEIARNVATGNGLTTGVLRPLGVGLAGDHADRVLFSAPLYPLVLSLPMRAFGISDNVVALTSMAFVLLTLVLVVMICARRFGERVAIGAVAMLALSVPFIQQGITGDELAFLTLIVTALFGVLLFWQRTSHPASQWWTVGAAVLIAMAWLTRHEMIVLLPSVVVFWLVADRERFRKRLLWTVLPVMVIAAPWIVHNVMLLERPVVSAESYTLLTGTTLYPGDSAVRRTVDLPDHPWVLAARNPGMMYLKVRERLLPLYHRIAMLANPFITAFFLAGAVIATARHRLSAIHWNVLLSIALTGLGVALYTDLAGLLICFSPIVTILAVFTFTEIVRELDQNRSDVHMPRGWGISMRLREWAGLGPRTRGTGRVIKFALVLLALVVGYPMVDYLFIQPPAQMSPVVHATAILGDEPYDLIVTDVPGAVTWYAGTRTMLLPVNQRQLQATREAGVQIDAIYMRMRPGMSPTMFPGFELVERSDLPGLLWEPVGENAEAGTSDG